MKPHERRDHAFLDPDRLAPPVVVVRGRYAAGAGAAHQHRRVQVLRSTNGTLVVSTGIGGVEQRWELRGSVALCIPAGLTHAVAADAPLELLSAYVVAGHLRVPRPRLLAVTPLMDALFERIEALGLAYAVAPPVSRLVAVLIDELRAAPALASWAAGAPPRPRSARLMQALAPLLKTPAVPCTLEALASQAGMSARTLQRMSARELGLSVGHWQLQMRLHAGLQALQAGRGIQRAAAAAGYSHAGNFGAAFRRSFGVTPGALLRGRAAVPFPADPPPPSRSR